MRLTIAYCTGRKEPRLDWMVQSLRPQLRKDDQIYLHVIDALAHTGRTTRDMMGGRLINVELAGYRHTPPKPNIWQGMHRITPCDFWAMSNARNTGFVYCQTDWIAFLDDRCVLEPTWLQGVRDAMAGMYIVAGAYEKRTGINDDGTGGERFAQDNRYESVGDAGHPNAPGQWLYGCTFALPLESALTVNGFEEGCDWLSAEDYIFGLNLRNAGYRIDYVPTMKIIEDRSPGTENFYRRDDKGVSPNDKSHAALARFGQRKRTEFTPDLRELRARLASGMALPIPDPNADHKDWYDGQLVRDIR
jgi:hypothetical protein